MKKAILYAFVLSAILLFGGCGSTDAAQSDNTENPAEQKFLDYLDNTNTTGFIIQKDGEIVLEKYWRNGESKSANIASAGKSICSVLVGIAIDQGYLKLEYKISDYIGNGFSYMSTELEDTITVESLLTMTSGLDDTLHESYVPNSSWEYSDAWNLLFSVLKEATGQDINSYAKLVLLDKLGMDDSYYKSSEFQLFIARGRNKPDYKDWDPYQIYCTPRDMLTFGQFILQQGSWDGEQLVSKQYLEKALQPSSTYNPAYGYLFWLNGYVGGLSPSGGDPLEADIIPNAPEDLVAALGYADKKIYIIPSKNMVIVRSGGAATDKEFAYTTFDNELWKQLNILFEAMSW